MESERKAVLHACLKNLHTKGPKKDQPRRGTFTTVAAKFKCDRRTVAALWHRFDRSLSDDLPGGDIDTRMKNAGRKKEHTLEELSLLIKAVPFAKRGRL